MARGSAYTDGYERDRHRDREPDYRDARSYYTDNDGEGESHGEKTHRRRHGPRSTVRERRHRRREGGTEETRLEHQLDIQYLRAARAEYYSRPTVERQRSARRMAQAVEVERVSSRRGTPIIRQARSVKEGTTSGSGTRQRRKRADEEREDEGFVYSREVRERARSPKVERTGTVRRAGTVRELEGRSRASRSMEAERPVRVVERVVSVKRADTPKVSRSLSAREPPKAYRTRPSLRRTNTTTRTAKAAPTAPSVRPSRAVSMSARVPATSLPPATTVTSPNRRSTGLLATLFKPSPPRTSQGLVQKPEPRVECIICMTDDLPAHRTAKLSCGHRMCHSCLKRQFSLSVNDPAHMPPTCCTTEHIPLKYVERLFDDKFKKLWNKKFQEYTTKNRLYCPTKGCGEWIKPSKIRMDLTVGRKYAQCGRCRTRVCVLCNGKFHIKKECPKDEETKQLVEMAQQKGWQRCYSCKTMVELKEGCNHMTCRCTAQFCMLCAARWKTCNCPWFNYTNLDDGDRLNDMRVPYDPHNNVVVEVPDARPRGFTNWSTRDRRAQERADEALAQRLQSQLLLSPTPVPSEGRSANVQVYGLGNAGAHHLNESYAVRPLASAAVRTAVSSQPAPPAPPAPPVYRRRLPMPRELVYEEPTPAPRPPEPEPAPTNTATMAGLARDGSRRGAGRVDVWLQYVQFDPAEVEGRGQVRVGGGDEW